jgi:hypothetical protein
MILSLLLAALGIVAFVTRRIGSATMSKATVSGNAAGVIGLAAIIIAIVMFVAWVRKRKRHSDR